MRIAVKLTIHAISAVVQTVPIGTNLALVRILWVMMNNGFGQLGDGAQTRRLTPVAVSGLGSGVLAISADSSHTCALTTGGGVNCWEDIQRADPVDASRVR